MSCRNYINNLTDNVNAQEKLEAIHNSIFQKIRDSKLFRQYDGITFLPNASASGRYSRAKSLLDTINEEHGFPVVGTAFTKATGREYAFVNVKNYLSQALGTVEQGDLFNDSPTRTTFLRHGVTLEDKQGKNSGQNSISLAKEGVKASEEAGKRLREQGIEKLYISPTKRSVDTAEATGISYQQVEGLSAWDLGEFTSKPENAFDEAFYVKNSSEKVPGGESFDEFVNRTKKAVDSISKEHAGKYAILTHSKSLKVIEALEQTKGVYNDKTKELYLKESAPSNDQVKNLFVYNRQEAPVYKIDSKAKQVSDSGLKAYKEFAKRAGITGEYVDEIMVDGQKVPAIGIVNFAKGLYQVVKGNETSAEPEEITHFAVRAIRETDPELFRKLLGEVTSYSIYRAVYRDYSRMYRTDDGKPDIPLIKEEAITKVLVNTISAKNEGKYDPELSETNELGKTWWGKIKEWFLKLINKAGFNPFEQTAERFLKGETFGVNKKLKELAEVITYSASGQYAKGFEQHFEKGEYFPILQSVYEQLIAPNIGESNAFTRTVDTLLNGDEKLGNEIIDYFKANNLYALDTTGQTNIYNKIKEEDANITKAVVTNDKGESEEKYFYKGKEVKTRVTTLVKNITKGQWENRQLTKSEYQNVVDDLKRQAGDNGHKDTQQILGRLIDDNGYLRANPTQEEYTPLTSKDVYNTLYSSVRDRLQAYPTGTRFFSEVKIYNPAKDLAGTIDFMAITPEGKTDVLDWKFFNIDTAKDKDVQWYNKRSWRLQMSMYKQMLEDAYKIEPSKFDKTQMIPIRANYSYVKGKDEKTYPVLTSIEVADKNVKLEKNDYLLPVSLDTQSTGDKKLDALLRKFVGLKQRVEKREVGNLEEKFAKAEQLNSLEQVIRHLQIKQTIEPLISQADVFNKDVDALINDYKNIKDNPKDYNGYADRIVKASKDIGIYTNLSNEVRHITKDNPELKKKVDDLVTKAREVQTDLWDTMKDFGEKLANNRGVFDFMDPEVVVSWMKSLIKSTSHIQTKAVNVLYEEEREALNKSDISTAAENEELIKIGKAYNTLADANGLNNKNYYKFIKKDNKNELIDQFKKQFYDEAKDAVKEKNYAWIKDNVRIEDYKAKLQEDLQKKIDLINNRPISEEDKNKRISELKIQYGTKSIDDFGWFLHYGILRQFPVETKWESDEWTTLHKPENKAALDLYNWTIDVMKKADDVGYIPEGTSARTFLPFVPQSLMEAVQMGDKPKIWERLLKSITIDEDTVGYGAIDRVSGEIINKIPRYFVSNTDKELSKDLVRNLGIFNEFLNKYKYLKDIEGKVLLLGELERAKGSIVTVHGKPVFNKLENRFETIDTNEKNADLYDKQVASIVYGQRYVADGKLDAMLGNAGELSKKINKVLGSKILPEEFTNKQFSLVKTADTLNSFFQFKTLGLSSLPALSNYIGGHLQLGILAGPYFGKREVVKAELQYIGAATSGEQGKKLIAAVKYFVPFTRDKNKDILRQLSITKLDDNSIQDFLMSFMRYGDKAVEGMIFGALWNNSILIDGKIHNARQYVRALPEYKARYGSADLLAEEEPKFQSKVDELIEKYGLAKQSKIVGDELVIPGVDRLSQEVFAVRNLVHSLSSRVIGNSSPGDVRGLNQSLIWNSMMIFKNWIPPLAETRFTGLQYNRDIEKYEWGRARNMMRMLAREGIKAFSTMSSAVQGTEKGLESLNDLYQYKQKKYYETTGQKLDISKEDFFDMVRDNIRQSAKDALFVIGMLSLWFAAKAIPPDDDEDPAVKNWHKFMVRALDKFSDEVNFYYSPIGWQQIIGGSIFPSIGLFKDFDAVFKHFLKEIYGIGFDEDLQEKNYVIKYLMKSFPVTSQLSTYLPLVLPDLAKELGIQPSAQSRIF